MLNLDITGPAKSDIQSVHDWWAQHKSLEEAHRWYLGIHAAIESLRKKSESCSFATERDLLEQGVRQLLFGLGRRPTHRIVFAIDDQTVVVLRVRHASQDSLTIEDLA
jgi:plasmid stabilization system protein ParE